MRGSLGSTEGVIRGGRRIQHILIVMEGSMAEWIVLIARWCHQPWNALVSPSPTDSEGFLVEKMRFNLFKDNVNRI